MEILILLCLFRSYSFKLLSRFFSMARSRNAIVATGLVVFAAAGLAFPFYMA